MMRVTDLMKTNSLVRNLNRQQYEMDKVQNQLATGQKIEKPSDDPGVATNQMFFRSRLKELGQFGENVYNSADRLKLMDGELARVTDILQRIRELTVQASNGIYQGDDGFELKEAIASEVDQHLRALIEIANGRDAVRRPLFGGHVVEQEPFRVIHATVPGLKGLENQEQIVRVEYRGDIGSQMREVERDQYIDVNIPGNRVFWGTNMTVTGGVDTSEYVSTADQSFKIDGTEIRVAAGDTVNDIIDKINRSGIEVKASRIGQDFLSLHTTTPHQIWLEDAEGGTVLRDLGLVNPSETEPPANYAADARGSGMSLFDVVIKLRNDLMAADQLEISGRDLGNLDEALDNVLRYRSQVGARENRLEEHDKRIAWDKTYMTELLSKSEGIDVPETIMNMKWLESVHQYALNVGSRIIRPTLMDFLR